MNGRALLLDPSQLRENDDQLARMMSDPLSRAELSEQLEATLFGTDMPPIKNGLFILANGIAYIPISGVLFNDDFVSPVGGFSGYKGLSIQFASAMADDEVRAILFDVKSPGGDGDGVFDLSDEIFAARGTKPIWAIANPVAASAAYAIASAADLVFLPRFARAGSIGVWTAHVDLSGMLAQDGVKVTLIFAGDRKVDGNPWEPLSEQARATLQDSVDRMRAVFVQTVARNRSLDETAVRASEAALFEDINAVSAGLADAVATDQEVAAALMEEITATAIAAA